MTVQRRADGTVYFATGTTGSGKTSWLRERTRGERRVLVWDGKGIDWGPRQGYAVGTLRDLQAQAMAPGPMRLSVRVAVTKETFRAFCQLAWVWARHKPGVIMVDELADVTDPGKAPVAWGEIVRKVRAYGSTVYVTTQRPQECDSTVQGNAHVYHVGLQSDQDDQLYVAKRLLGSREHLKAVAALRPLEWIERDVRTRRITTGRIRPR